MAALESGGFLHGRASDCGCVIRGRSSAPNQFGYRLAVSRKFEGNYEFISLGLGFSCDRAG